jgi:tRNA pseudouridine55 synthase
LEGVLPQFCGTVSQIPPIFSAIRKDGKQLYKSAREGKSAEDMEIEARTIEIYRCDLLHSNENRLPKFDIDVECGGGTYIRSLIRDIGYKLNTVATTTYLERTQQGQFTLDASLSKDDWTAGNIYAAIEGWNVELGRSVAHEAR